MDPRDAAELISTAVPPGEGGLWADFGAGEGVFTAALAHVLGPAARIYAVDRDQRALAKLARWVENQTVTVIPVAADFTQPFDLPGLGTARLDGILFANALHFVRHPEPMVARLAALLRPGGRVVIVEYDRRAASRWVPHPLPVARLPELAAAARLTTPAVTGTRPSAFGGVLYAAVAERRNP